MESTMTKNLTKHSIGCTWHLFTESKFHIDKYLFLASCSHLRRFFRFLNPFPNLWSVTQSNWLGTYSACEVIAIQSYYWIAKLFCCWRFCCHSGFWIKLESFGDFFLRHSIAMIIPWFNICSHLALAAVSCHLLANMGVSIIFCVIISNRQFASY